MKFSESWLREWIKLELTAEQIAHQLTMAGLEVDGVHPVAESFSHVVVGEVLSAEQHPKADRLRVCQVDVAQAEPLQIVCGGVNVRQGIKVPVALVGAELPGGLTISNTELRGVASQGMICAARELGIDEASAVKHGIMELPLDATVGVDLHDYLQLDDRILAIDLTPNRSDCLSMRGIARELSAINGIPYQDPEVLSVPAQHDEQISLQVLAPEACPNYVSRVIKSIRKNAATPLWMQEKLRRGGIRSIHPVVDVCNFVMLELGQPMHAFDQAKLIGQVQVRYSQSGERITLLDEREIVLQEGTCLIADDRRPLAIAGIMGGLDSALDENSQDIVLESAFFNPVNISIDSRRYHISSDSAYRFARGVDHQLQVAAIERATELLLDFVGGSPGPVVQLRDQTHEPTLARIVLRRARIPRLLGMTIADEDIERILSALGMTLESSGTGWLVTVPGFRFDITQEVDLIEELARLHGYNDIPATPLPVSLSMPNASEHQLTLSQLTEVLVARGYSEAISYSFVSPAMQSMLTPEERPITVSNPLSEEMSVMRSTMWSGLLNALQFNQNRQCDRVRLFESGLVFQERQQEWLQRPSLALLAAGRALPEQWGVDNRRQVDFYDVKADIEALLGLAHDARYVWRKASHPALHPGQAAVLLKDEQVVGTLGVLHPELVAKLDLDTAPVLFEAELTALVSSKLPCFTGISKFPSVRRDLALVVDIGVEASTISQLICESAGHLLSSVQIFDLYQGEGLPDRKKSVAMGLTFQDPSRTLRDEEINNIIHNVVGVLASKLNATLRT